jgi:hypothetical protein
MAQQFLGELEEIYTGAQGGYVNRWSAANFFDKVLFATSSISPIYWPGTFPYQSPESGTELGRARQIPGLPSTVGYDGVEVIGGHVVLWKDEVLTWSDLNDFTCYIPVATTAVSLVGTTLTSFTHPASGFESDEWIHIDEDSSAFVEGQFVRVEVYPNDPTQALYHFYEVSSVASPVGIGATSIGVDQSVSAGSTGTRIYTDEYSAWGIGSRLIVDGTPTTLEVTESSRDLTGTFTSNLISDPVPAVGETFRIRVAENPSSLKVGDVLSVGDTARVGLDLYEVVQVAFYLTLRRLGVGTQRQATNYRFASGTYLTFQPFVGAKNDSVSSESILSGTDLSAQLAIKVTGLGLTGEATVGDTIPSGVQIYSLDANEAGQAINAGSNINGSIFGVVAVGELGVILKERSIQSMQYVGRNSGTFFIRLEIPDEGPISKNAWCRMGENRIAFVGHKELYAYSGGQMLTPIAQQHTQEVFAEMDRSRADEIVLAHVESKQELWFVYPTLTGSDLKVMIYNYKFGSVAIDYYDKAALGSISAVGEVDWETAPTWDSLSDTLYWENETRKWYELVDEGLRRYPLIGVSAAPADPALGEEPDTTVPRILLHGRKYSRADGDNCNPEAYTALAETQDFDFGDGSVWKYADTLQLDLEVDEHLARPMYLYVQLGARNSLDSDIRWSTPARVECSGNGQVTTKVNIRMAGRFLRLRFYSNAIDTQWRVAGFKLIARPGGTF